MIWRKPASIVCVSTTSTFHGRSLSENASRSEAVSSSVRGRAASMARSRSENGFAPDVYKRQALAGLGVVTSVLIGQRMGVVLTAVGMAGTALLIPQLRRVTLVLLVLAVLVLLATPVISPPTYAKLVGETYRNLHHFTLSPYGELRCV